MCFRDDGGLKSVSMLKSSEKQRAHVKGIIKYSMAFYRRVPSSRASSSSCSY